MNGMERYSPSILPFEAESYGYRLASWSTRARDGVMRRCTKYLAKVSILAVHTLVDVLWIRIFTEVHWLPIHQGRLLLMGIGNVEIFSSLDILGSPHTTPLGGY